MRSKRQPDLLFAPARLCWALAPMLLAALATPSVAAASPTTTAVHGALRSASGGPASDGEYTMTFSLHATLAGGAALWQESANVTVSQGRFMHVLGSVKPLPIALLHTQDARWIGVKIGNEPQLPRQPLHAAPWARSAQRAFLADNAKTADLAKMATSAGTATVAKSLSCAGCVGVAAMKFDQDVDLGGNGLKAKKLTASDVAASTVSAASFVGDGSKLTGIQTVAGTCKGAGEVVKGVGADGSLQCVKAVDPKGLPADALDDVSGGLLTTEFTIVTEAKDVPKAIPDNNPVGVSSDIVVPDVGIIKTLEVSAKVSNSAVEHVEIFLYAPDNSEYALYSKGKKGKTLSGLWPTKDKVLKGDLGAWVGKNGKGIWRLKVVDGKFFNNKGDGAIDAWSISIGVVSTKKVAATGAFQFHVAAKAPVPCKADNLGAAWVDAKTKALRICNGEAYVSFSLEQPPGSEGKPAQSCKALHAVEPAFKSGVYWLAAKAGAYQAWCDMDTKGGGWTLVAKMNGAVNTFAYDAKLWTDETLLATDKPALDKTQAKLRSFTTMAITELLIVMEAGGQTRSLAVPRAATSARAAFAAATSYSKLGRNAWKALVSGASMQPHCNREGFNITCGGRKVRLGYLTNQENDCNSCDSFLGIGHSGGNGCNNQKGYTQGMMASCSPDNGDKAVPGFVWLFGR